MPSHTLKFSRAKPWHTARTDTTLRRSRSLMTKRSKALSLHRKMSVLHAFFVRQRAMAFAILAFALAMKAIVPTGFMIGAEAKVLTIRLCNKSQFSSAAQARQIAIPMNGKPASKHDKADEICPYSALSMASLSNTDLTLLSPALAFILALTFTPGRTACAKRIFYLRPPLRAPPVKI